MMFCEYVNKVTFCPPAIAQGADVNPITKAEVAELRRRWFGDFRRQTGSHFKRATVDQKRAMRPQKVKPKRDRTNDWMERIQLHAKKHTEKTWRQRPWSIVIGWSETQLRAFIAGTGALNYKKLLREFDTYLDDFRPKGPPS